MKRSICNDINTLSRFLGPRDLQSLTCEEMVRVLGEPQADVFVLFGGSIVAGCDVLAEAIRSRIAKTYIIVGGAGHTTQALRDTVHALIPEIETANEPEAVIFDRVLRYRYGLSVDHTETASTNCGNNITNLLELMRREHISCRSIVLCQDASMQRRMEATLRKYAPTLKILNYSSYEAELNEELEYSEEIPGMWTVERYLTLLMGEIPRLTDDENGYGPHGRDFIAHTEIPEHVREAFDRLQAFRGDLVRKADSRYAG